MNEKIKTNADLGPTEAIVDNIRALHGTVGCDTTGRDVMIAGCVQEDPRAAAEPRPTFHDLYLTWGQALSLYNDLSKVLQHFPHWLGVLVQQTDEGERVVMTVMAATHDDILRKTTSYVWPWANATWRYYPVERP